MVSKYTIAGAAAVGLGGLWTWRRLVARAELTQQLSVDPTIMAAVETGKLGWLPHDRAASLIGPLTTMSVPEAFSVAAAEARAVLPLQDEVSLLDDVGRMTEPALAEAKEKAAGVYESLPDIPLIDTSSWLPDWITGIDSPEYGT